MQLQALMTSRSLAAPVKAAGSNEFCRRPNQGTLGRAVKILANHFLVNTTASFVKQCYHYDVKIVPVDDEEEKGGRGARKGKEAAPGAEADRSLLPPRLNASIINLVAKKENWALGWGYDRRANLYAPTQVLPQPETEHNVVITEGDRTRTYNVTTMWVATINTANLIAYIKGTVLPEVPRDAFQALDVVLRHTSMNDPTCRPVGRNFYYDEGHKNFDLGGGLEAWKGYGQNFRVTQQGLALTVDLAATPFVRAGPVGEFLAIVLGFRNMQDWCQKDYLSMSQTHKASKAMAGMQVMVASVSVGKSPRKKRVQAVGASADKISFMNEKEKKEMTVAEYFKSTKRPLKHDYLPCLNVGDRSKPVWVPLERCEIVSGQRKMKMDPKQTSNMIRVAAQKPQEKQDYLKNLMANQSFNAMDAAIPRWGLNLTKTLTPVDARVLRPPMLQYGLDPQKDIFSVQPGAWNLIDVKFCAPMPIKSYAVACVVDQSMVQAQGPADLLAFMGDMRDMMRKCGMAVPQELPPIAFPKSRNAPVSATMADARAMAMAKFKFEPQVIFVIIPRREVDIYRDIKKVSDLEMGIPSSVITMEKANIGPQAFVKGRPDYCANVALKINAKLNGVNVKLAGGNGAIPIIGKAPFMVMGADVTHPTSRDVSDPSVAAVCCSMDSSLGRYATRVMSQTHRTEIVANLDGATYEFLKMFMQQNGGKKPEAIMFYRDGVGDNQFAEVRQHEYNALRIACSRIDASYTPRITFIIVQKRHNTRLFAANPGDADRSGNIPAGTVVDTKICHPTDYDFYLNSHSGIQGTNKPAHYHVLVDDNGFGADAVQALTYNLCYTYARCTRSISVCTPAYYAHLAAFRGKFLMETGSDSSSEASTVSGQAPQRTLQIHPKLANHMFFM
jgi:eukaryotic translation initiation factor 2C